MLRPLDSNQAIRPCSRRLRASLILLALSAGILGALPAAAAIPGDGPFRRLATFPVFLNTDVDSETVSEIIAAAEDGTILIYTDGANEALGFIDLADPADPKADGNVDLGGEPTSVSVVGGYALAAVNTSESFVNPSGNLQVIDIAGRMVLRTIDLGGQPDSIAVSPDGRYAAVVIENERDEDLGDGAPPQAPGGFLVIVDLVGDVAAWTTRDVSLMGVADLFPNDPEPEFVDINELDQAAVTLQENNHIAIVDLATGAVISDFSSGTVDLVQVDDTENDLIQQTADLDAVPREPDAVAWTSANTLATADEGDLDGGSRGFTIFDTAGQVLFTSGNSMEHLVARIGHYPEDRSENKGNEPEAVEVGRYDGGESYLFVGSERSSVVAVYDLGSGPLAGDPELVQVLPAGFRPEGLLAIPERDLFVVSAEEDDRGDKFRSSVSVYQRFRGGSDYPKVRSADRADGTPIPWGALSGLALDSSDPDTAYTIYDSFYVESRIFTVDISGKPAVITAETPITDGGGLLAGALAGLQASLPGAADFDPADLVNGDGTVNLDPEGVASRTGGGYWLASEGAGNLAGGVSNPDDRPFTSPNLLLGIGADGSIDRVELLPFSVASNQLRFGLEGVAEGADGTVYVAFQRAWGNAGDPSDRVRIGRFEPGTGAWTFAYYPLDDATSPNGGWVGLSEITHLGGGTFAVIERDNQAGTDATVKRIYTFAVAGVTFADDSAAPAFPLLAKTLATDLLADGHLATTGGSVLEKWEGLLALPDGTALIVNDNDGSRLFIR
ncbi:MAG: esterase-like activity of phytase family protein [Holophagales bacterium]|nr:esterase-like activity of phytase family protein [Holophagales bacterium]